MLASAVRGSIRQSETQLKKLNELKTLPTLSIHPLVKTIGF
jgi:hypothetical protein